MSSVEPAGSSLTTKCDADRDGLAWGVRWPTWPVVILSTFGALGRRKWVMVICGVALLSSCSSGGGEDTALTVQQTATDNHATTTVIESTAAHEPVDELKDDERNDYQTEIAEVDSSDAQETDGEQQIVTKPAEDTAPPVESQPTFDIFQLTDWPGDERGLWTPDGSRILIIGNPDGDDDQNLYVVDADGSNMVQLTDWPGNEWVKGWSPDGSRILIGGDPVGDGNQNLYVVDADGSNMVQLTDWPGYESGYWSTDGSRILIISKPNSTDRRERDVFVVDVDGSNMIQLTDWPGYESGYWSPDGSRILIIGNPDGDGNQNLFVVDADGSNMVQLTDWPTLESVKWFPDGSRILISGNPKVEQIFDGDIYGYDVDYYVVDADGSNMVQLTDWPGYVSGEWSPDGSRILILITGVESVGYYVVDVDELLLVQTDWTNYFDFARVSAWWSPDGSRFLINNPPSSENIYNNNWDIYVVGADWSDGIQLTNWPGRELGSWSPDSSQILIHSQPEPFWDEEENEEQNIYVVDADGSNMVQLTDWPGYESGEWSPDGSLIVISGNPDSADRDEDDIFVIRVFPQ